MTILNETAALLRRNLGDEPFAQTVERMVIGLFFTGVKLRDGSCGVCYTPAKEIPEAVCCPTSAVRGFDPTRVADTSVDRLLAGLGRKEPLHTAVCAAALSALSATCFERTGAYRILRDVDALDAVRIPDGAAVAVVGALVPAMRRLRKHGGEWWVLEKDPRTLKGEELEHFVPAERAAEAIPRADVLIVTGATLVTHSLESILELAGPDAEIAVLGPTVGFLPDALFERNVRVVGGVLVNQPDALLDLLAAAGSGYHFFQKLTTRTVILAE